MSSPGISRRIQNRLDAVFMPAGIQRSVAEIIEIRKAGKTSDYSGETWLDGLTVTRSSTQHSTFPTSEISNLFHSRAFAFVPTGSHLSGCPKPQALASLTSITSLSFIMRLPGTFNLGGRNGLPTAEFLIHYENLKRAKERAKVEREANNFDKAEFGDKPFPKRITSTSKKGNNDAKKSERPDVVTTSDGTFTKAQDDTIIQMKMEGKTWAMIGAEIGKSKDAVNSRFKDIKPVDFDVKEKEWKEKNGGGGQNQGKKNKGQNNQNNQNNQNENKENQNQNQGGKGNNNNNQNQNHQQHEGKKNKNKNNQQDNQNNNNKNWNKNKKEEAEAGAEDDDADSESGTWAVPDENFTEKEVTVLEKIVEIELRNAFVRISKSFAAHPEGKRVHPDSITQKVLGEALDLSSLGGAS